MINTTNYNARASHFMPLCLKDVFFLTEVSSNLPLIPLSYMKHKNYILEL